MERCFLILLGLVCLTEDASLNNERCEFTVEKCEYPCQFGYDHDDDGCPFQNCSCASGGTFEGDIKFDSNDIPLLTRTYNPVEQDLESGASNDRPLWNEVRLDGRVKIGYVLGKNLTAKAKIVIGKAIERYRDSTCIDFIPWTNEKDYIYFVRDKGCWSFVGKRGGPQLISIGVGCAWTGIVEHEIMHALGFWHEQSRPDRDDYIEVKTENIRKGSVHNFKIRARIDSFGSEYDKSSIMHYSGFTFSDNGKPTIIDRSTGQPIVAQRDHMTKSDLRQVNTMYNCTGKVIRGDWTEWSSTTCSKTCGGGKRTRVRSCMKNKLVVPARHCDGESREEQDCNVKKCPPQGEWSSWHPWTSCSTSCAGGYQLRTCIGQNCIGGNWEIRECNTERCSAGFFSVTVKSPANCEGEIVFSDFNKDGKDDLFCFHSEGRMELFVSCRTPFSKKFWEGKIEECGGKHHCGDFDGDGFEDVLCVDKTKGLLHVTLGSGGTFEKASNWQGKINDFCQDGEITASHITDDQKMDIVCLSNDGNISALVTSST